jgi:hypothetical protein
MKFYNAKAVHTDCFFYGCLKKLALLLYTCSKKVQALMLYVVIRVQNFFKVS